MSSNSVKKITINKVGSEPTPPPVVPETESVATVPMLAGSKHRTFPRGILRKTSRRKPVAPKPTSDPTSSRKKTLRILTGAGQKKIRSTLRKQVKRLDDKTIRQKLIDKKLISSHSKADAHLLRKMYEEAVGAGLLKL